MKKYLLTLSMVFLCQFFLMAQVNYTANDQVTTYTGLFRPGINFDYYPPYTSEDLANIASGNPALGLTGIGAKTSRPAMRESFAEDWGYDYFQAPFQHFHNVGMDELTMIVGFPAEWHRDQNFYCDDADPMHAFCSNDPYTVNCQSTMFANLYTPIWDGGLNGTPYNDDNYLAAYMYKMVTNYKDHVRFWEIWNEPGFDHSYVQGWQQPGGPDNWWDNDPSPCVNHFKAPIEHFVRTLRICYDVIKTVDPDAYVTLAGVGFESFLDAVLRNTDNPVDGSVTPDYPLGGGAYFDVMGFHTYPDIDGSVREWNNVTNQWDYHRNSDAAAAGIKNRRDTYANRLAMYGYDGVTYPKKEWIITEINVPRVKFGAQSMASDETQTNYITKAVVQAMKIDVRQMHPYQLADRKTAAAATGEFDLLGMYLNFTNTNPYESLVKTNEGIAYKTTSDVVYKTTYDAARTAAMNLPDNLDGAAFYDPANQRYKYILWAKTTLDLSEAASGTYSFPASFGITTLSKREWNYSETYNAMDIGPDNIALTGRPIYLLEPSNAPATVLSVDCPTDTTILGSAEEVTLSWDIPTGSTTCSVPDLTIIQTQGPALNSTTPWTVNETVVYQISDDCDNTTTCQFQVIGLLQTPEIAVTCPSDIAIEVPAGSTGATVTWNESDVVVTANCGDASTLQIGGPASGSQFPIGTTTVQYLGLSTSCQDSLTLTSNCSFDVVVTEAGGTGSVLSVNCPSDTTIVGSTTEVSLTWSLPTATSTCANPDVTVTQTAGPSQGTVYTSAIQVPISYSITDSCGNSSSCNFTVNGQLQVVAPEISITCPGDINIEVPATDTGAVVTWDENNILVTANCGMPSSTQVLGLPNGSFFPIGETVIKYAGISQCNSMTISAVCEFTVTVTQLVGTHQVNEFAKFDLFPNPTSDFVTLSVEADQAKDIRIEVVDNLGRVLLTEKHGFTSGQLDRTLNLHDFANGVYFIKVKTDGQVGVKRVTVSK
ncbi:MAG TPA: HYR domain-containing protein [Saprospiraceae bacterium]|nr:HYR domain-containing protein [Saprospiraceae bacterium]